MKATRAELEARLRAEQDRYEQLERCWTQAKELAIKHAGERDEAVRKIDEERAIYHTRIEALHADLRTRTDERDAAQAQVQDRAELVKFTDELKAELAAAKIAIAEVNTEASRWANIARDTVLEVGRVRGQLESLASLTVKNGSAAVCLAEIVLAESKPCAP